MSKSIYICMILALALALLVAGCGSDSSDSSSSISKAEFVKRASAICQETDLAQYNKITKYARDEKIEIPNYDQDYRETVVTTFTLPLVQKETKELKALGVPDGDEKQVEAFISEIEKGIAKAEKDPALVMEEQGSGNPFFPANKQARTFGIEACAYIG